MKTVLGVDPGRSGAICWHDGHQVHAKAMPETRGDCIALIKQIHGLAALAAMPEDNIQIVAYHEKIQGYIPDGGPSMMFQFGASCERVSCILETLGIRVIEVTPQAWIKALGLGSKGLTKAPPGASAEEKASVKAHNATAKRDWKNKLKERAQRLFPGVPVTLKTCDALLILEYGMAREGGGQVIVHGVKPFCGTVDAEPPSHGLFPT